MKILLSTTNKGKIQELRSYLAKLDYKIMTLSDIENVPEVIEDCETLAGNAAKKAETLYNLTGWPTLADDTGLMVEALNDRPGVYSARYAGPNATDADNRALLLKELATQTNRAAKFMTVIAFTTSDGTQYYNGECQGIILTEERGESGFGYDSLFQPEGFTKTFAELSKTEKSIISHRGRALNSFVEGNLKNK